METSYYHQMARMEDNHWWFRGRRAVVAAFLRRHLPRRPADRARRILDAGCGAGAMLPLLQKFGQVEALDSSEEALGLCRARVGDSLPVFQGQLPDGIPSGQSYDLITAFDVIEHIPDAPTSLRAVRDALAPGGAFVCTVPAFGFLWGPHDEVNHHCRRYTRALLETHLDEAGFEMRRASYFNTLLFPPIAAVRLGRKVLPAPKGEAHSDFGQDAKLPPFNELLSALFTAEARVVPRYSIPVGVSLIALATPRRAAPPRKGCDERGASAIGPGAREARRLQILARLPRGGFAFGCC